MGHLFTFLLIEIGLFFIRSYLDYDKNMERRPTQWKKRHLSSKTGHYLEVLIHIPQFKSTHAKYWNIFKSGKSMLCLKYIIFLDSLEWFKKKEDQIWRYFNFSQSYPSLYRHFARLIHLSSLKFYNTAP